MTEALRPQSVLIKTPKGLAEIDRRIYKLPGRLRAILFMVDGERTFAGLLEQAGNMAGQLEIQLQELATMGFIAAIAGESTDDADEHTPAAAAMPVATKPVDQIASVAQMASPAAPAAVTKAPEDIAVLKTRIGAMLAETLGMRAMMLSTQLEGIRSTAELGNFIDDTARSVAMSNGGKTAEQWRARARAIAGF